MKSLREQLAAMERRWKKTRFWRAAAMTIALLVIVIAVAAAVDYFFTLTMAQRRLLTIGMYGSVLIYIIFGWLLPYRRKSKPETIAWMLEDAVPSFNEKLISAVELTAKKDGGAPKALSRDMIERVLGDARVDLEKIQPERVFPISWKMFIWPALIFTLFIAAFFVPQLQFGKLVQRVAFPSDRQATVGGFGLFVDSPGSGSRPEGAPLEFVVECTSPDVRNVQLCIADDRTRKYPMAFDEKQNRFVTTFADARQSFRFWAQSGDVLSSKHTMEILQRPRVEALTLDYIFPEYTGIPTAEGVPSSNGAVKGVPGTTVELTVTASKPLGKLTMTWLDEDIDMTLDATGTTAVVSREIERSGTYSLHLADTDGLENLHDLEFTIDALDDEPPTITLVDPTGEIHLGIDDVLPLAWDAADDFGIAKTELVIVRAQEAPVTLSIEPSGPAPTDPEDPDAVISSANAGYAWDLDKTGLSRGEKVSYFVRVTDAVGQSDLTEPRSLSLLASHQLEQAARFAASADDLLRTLDGLQQPLDNAERVRRQMVEARGIDVDDLPHNRAMLGKQAGQIALQLATARDHAADMGDNGFYRLSRRATDLLTQYMEQERVRSTSRLVNFDAPKQTERGMTDLLAARDLGLRATRELRRKGDQHVPVIELDVLRSTLAAAADTPETRARLAARARDIASLHREDAVAKFTGEANLGKLPVHLGWLRNELSRAAGDTKDLEALIAELEDRLRSDVEDLAALKERLDMFNRPADWSEVAAIAAATEAKADQTPDMQEQEDLRLAAELLRAATEEQDTEKIATVANALPKMQAASELRAMEQQLAEARQQASDLQEAAEGTENTDPESPAEAALAELEAAVKDLQESTLDGQPLHKTPVGDKLLDKITDAEQNLPNVEKAVAADKPEDAAAALAEIESDLAAAEQLAAERAAELQETAEAAREQLTANTDQPSDRVQQMKDALAAAEAQLASDPELAEATAERVADDLADLASDLERAARAEIADESGDIQAAREEMALAEELRDVSDQAVEPLQAALNPDQPAPDAEQQFAEAREQLAAAQDLLQRREQAEGMELSMSEREQLRDELDQLAEAQLDPELLDTLDLLEQLRRNSEEAEALAEVAQDLEKRHQSFRARQLAEDIDDLQSELGETLVENGKAAFLLKAEDVIAEAAAGTEDLLTEARAFRAELREEPPAKRSTEERKEAAAEARDLAAQAAALEGDLARADAVRELMNPAEEETPSLAEALAKQTREAFEDAAVDIERRRDADDHLEDAVEGIKAAEDALAETADALRDETPEGMSPEMAERIAELAREAAAEQAAEAEAQALKESAPKANMAALSEQLAQMKDRMTEARAADEANKVLSAEATPLKQAAAQTLAGIDPDLLDEREQASLQRQLDDLAEEKKNLWDAANLIDQAAGMVYDRDESASADLKEQAKELREDAKRLVAPLDQTKGHKANMKKALNDVGSHMQRELARVDHPLAASAAETIDQMRENLDADTLDAAKRNVEAIEDDLMSLAGLQGGEENAREAMADVPSEEQVASAVEDTLAEAAAAPDPEAAANPSSTSELSPDELLAAEPAFAEAANPEQDLQARQGLLEAGRFAMEQPADSAPREAAREVAEGDLEGAAEAAPNPVAETFKEAAKLAAAAEAVHARPAPVQDRDPLAPGEEAKLAKQAEEDRVGLLADAQETAEKAAAAAKAVEDALQAKDKTPSEKQVENLAAAIDELEAQRDALGARGHDAFEALENLEDAVAAMEEAKKNQSPEANAGLQALSSAVADMQKQLAAEEKRQQAYDDLQKLAQDLEAAAEAAEATPENADLAKKAIAAAEALQKATEEQAKAGGLLSEAAAEAAENAAEAIKADPATAEGVAKEALAAVEKLDPGQEAKVAPNEEALDAIAAAEALNNQAALADALAGDYESAKEKMKAQADVLEGPAKEAAEQAAKEFAASRELQMEELDALNDKLDDAIADADALAESAGPVSAERIETATDAARAGDLPAASEALSEALAAADDLDKKEIARLKNAEEAVREAAENQAAEMAKSQPASDGAAPSSAAERLAEAAAEEAKKTAEDLVGKTDNAAAKNALGKAVEAAAAGDLAEAAEQLAEAADSLPENQAAQARSAQQAAEAADALQAPYQAAAEAAGQAARAVEALAEKTDDPLALNQLANAAEAAAEGDLERLSEELADAQLALPPELAEAAGDAREGVEAAREAVAEAGELPLSDAALEGIEALGKPVPEALAAALEEDYKSAMEAARRAGQRDAAEKFAEAMDEQVDALSPAARDGLKKLEEAMKIAPPTDRKQLAEAAKAARRGDLEAAAAEALNAVAPKQDAVELAENLQAAADFARDTLAPLKKAEEDAKRNQFQRAAMHAAEAEPTAASPELSEAVQDAQEKLAAAADAVQEAAESALADSYTAPDADQRKRLNEVARNAMAGKLPQALQSAEGAGEAGEEAKAALRQAMQAADEAKAALGKAIQQAQTNNSAAQDAKEGLQAAKQATAKAHQDALADSQNARQNANVLKQAVDALHKQDLKRAEQLAAQVGAEDLAEAIEAMDGENAKLPGGRHESHKLGIEARVLARAEEIKATEAQRTAQLAQTAENTLNLAGQNIDRQQFEQGAERAEQAAMGAAQAKEAAEAFAQAAAQEQAAAELAAQAKEQAEAEQAAVPFAAADSPPGSDPEQTAGVEMPSGQPGSTDVRTTAPGSTGSTDVPVGQSAAEPPRDSPSEPTSQPGSETGQLGGEPGSESGQPSGEPGSESGRPSSEPSGQPGEQGEPSAQGQPGSQGQPSSQSQPGPSGQPGAQGVSPPSSSSSPSPLPTAELTDALMDLGEAQAGVGSKEQVGESAEQLQNAADTLAAAAEQLAEQAMGQLPTQQAVMPSQPGESGAPPGSQGQPGQPGPEGQQAQPVQPGQPGESGQDPTEPSQQPGEPGQPPGQGGEGGEGGPQGNQGTQADDVSGVRSGPLGDTWEGAQGELRSDDKTTRKEQYNDYYRKANQQYLQQLKKKSKR